MAALNATFTLPGIAGIVLTMGMAVDANVLIFERLREEQLRAHQLALLSALQPGKQPTADSDELDVLAAEMLGEWEESLGELVEPVEAALAAATSFEDFQAALEERIAGIEPERLVEMLARGQFAARMWGRLNAPRRPAAEK